MSSISCTDMSPRFALVNVPGIKINRVPINSWCEKKCCSFRTIALSIFVLLLTINPGGFNGISDAVQLMSAFDGGSALAFLVISSRKINARKVEPKTASSSTMNNCSTEWTKAFEPAYITGLYSDAKTSIGAIKCFAVISKSNVGLLSCFCKCALKPSSFDRLAGFVPACVSINAIIAFNKRC